MSKFMEIAREGLTCLSIDGRRYLRCEALAEAGLRHLFTTVDDQLKVADCPDPEGLKRDHRRICEYLTEDGAPFYFMYQVHSRLLAEITEDTAYEACVGGRQIHGVDGLYTALPHIVLASSYADCVPLLFYDPRLNVQANVHSGWRGTLAGIANEAIARLSASYGSKPEDLLVAVGPHIGPRDFEVTHELTARFAEAFPDLRERIIVQKDETHDLIDLATIINYTLQGAGVRPEHIHISDLSTVAHPDLLHSFRRDGQNFGMMRVFSVLNRP